MASGAEALAGAQELGALLELVRRRHAGYELCAHWSQGEFHHDVVVRVVERRDLSGAVLVVSTNCNGGVKEVCCFAELPKRGALWHARCPAVAEFRRRQRGGGWEPA